VQIGSSLKVRLWLVGVFVLLGVLLWGGLRTSDPLAPYIADDGMRHIVGFAALGVIAAAVRQSILRLAALASIFFFALAFEIMQGPWSPREASWSDLAASCIGALAGYGLGQLIRLLLEVWRDIKARGQERETPQGRLL
jgi:VanZ family protein